MKSSLLLLTLFTFASTMNGQSPSIIDKAWLQAHLKNGSPRLIWQKGDEDLIRARITQDKVARDYHAMLMARADRILENPVAERVLEGRRLLGVSRMVLTRTVTLAYAWRMSGDEKYSRRLDAELEAVCQFSDWNPSHFLDVAEMATAVAFGIDWCRDGLSPDVIKMAKTALMEKAMSASEQPKADYWATTPSNWNQVCNGGMTAAALASADEYPDQAVRMINRMLDGLPHVLKTYAPDGVYVEGATYWMYGTGYNVILLSMLDSALGTDFGLADYPGFMESADFLGLVKAPSGLFYNYFDCGDMTRFNTPLVWFAMKTGEPRYAQVRQMDEMARQLLKSNGQFSKMFVFAFLWYMHYQPGPSHPLPLVWYGRSENPIIIFRSAFDDPDALYLAAKGGHATLNHGNMDAGSFILELNGVRWSIDPGNQNYNELEQLFKRIGGSLWDNFQESRRWTLLTKNNLGHSTLNIDGHLFANEGQADVIDFDADKRTATINLGKPLASGARKAARTFLMTGDSSVEIIDNLVLEPFSKQVTWQMMTCADVRTTADGAILTQGGQSLQLVIRSPEGVHVSVISLDPPPLSYDKQIPGLKRIEITVPYHLTDQGAVVIDVTLAGM